MAVAGAARRSNYCGGSATPGVDRKFSPDDKEQRRMGILWSREKGTAAKGGKEKERREESETAPLSLSLSVVSRLRVDNRCLR